jgi:transcriptional regulator with XRE-family HTH domain
MDNRKLPSASCVKATDDTDRSIGGRLRFWRRTLNIDSKVLAKKLKITYQQLQKYEKGINRVSASRLYHIAQLLRIPVSYFYQDLDLISQSAPNSTTKDVLSTRIDVVEFMSTDVAMDLCRAFVSINNPLVKEAILALIVSVATNGDKKNPKPAAMSGQK